MAEPRIWTELLTYGLGVALSPIHIVLLLLLLLGGLAAAVRGVVCGRLAADQRPGGDRPGRM